MNERQDDGTGKRPAETPQMVHQKTPRRLATFKILHDSEGVHRQHSPRLIPSGIAAHDIEVGGVKVAEFCAESLSRIKSHRSMLWLDDVTELLYNVRLHLAASSAKAKGRFWVTQSLLTRVS